MVKRWKKRPQGSSWGEFGDDDQRGRMNLLTNERRLSALQEVKTGRVFCLCHPLDRPGGNVLNASRFPPVFHPVKRDGLLYFNLAFERVDPRFTDVGSDEAVMLYTQYSTHWDGFPHKGSLFDADGDNVPEKVFYKWIADSGLAAIAADNLAVERSSTLGADPRLPHRGPALPLHEHCLFKLGIHLGELWYLTELAAWLRESRRSRFLLTAPPLRLPGAAGSPVTPVATV